jgi:hypothetical protein
MWQSLGKSNAGVMNQIKNRRELRLHPHLDITSTDPSDWGIIKGNPSSLLVFVDDFIGSGQSICNLWAKYPHRLGWLLQRYPSCRAMILVVAGLKSGIDRVRQELAQQPWAKRVDFHVGIEFEEQDRCFSDNSYAFPDPAIREELRLFCITLGQQLQLGKDFWLGYDDSQSLVVFPEAVPNNSLPFLWHDQKHWIPLLLSTWV